MDPTFTPVLALLLAIVLLLACILPRGCKLLNLGLHSRIYTEKSHSSVNLLALILQNVIHSYSFILEPRISIPPSLNRIGTALYKRGAPLRQGLSR